MSFSVVCMKIKSELLIGTMIALFCVLTFQMKNSECCVCHQCVTQWCCSCLSNVVPCRFLDKTEKKNELLMNIFLWFFYFTVQNKFCERCVCLQCFTEKTNSTRFSCGSEFLTITYPKFNNITKYSQWTFAFWGVKWIDDKRILIVFIGTMFIKYPTWSKWVLEHSTKTKPQYFWDFSDSSPS